MTIRTELCEDGTFDIYTPYNKDFIAAIKSIGGAKWKASKKAWNIPGAGIDVARKAMQDCYGETDLIDSGKKVTIRVKFDEDYSSAYCENVTAFGKTLARAFGRDSGARVGDDVILEKGSVSSGGSRKNWSTEISAGSVFRLTVPEDIYLREKDMWDVELVEDTPKATVADLIAERDKLTARLAEIEKELALLIK